MVGCTIPVFGYALQDPLGVSDTQYYFGGCAAKAAATVAAAFLVRAGLVAAIALGAGAGAGADGAIGPLRGIDRAGEGAVAAAVLREVTWVWFSRGRAKVKVEPFSRTASTQIRPPKSSITVRQR